VLYNEARRYYVLLVLVSSASSFTAHSREPRAAAAGITRAQQRRLHAASMGHTLLGGRSARRAGDTGASGAWVAVATSVSPWGPFTFRWASSQACPCPWYQLWPTPSAATWTEGR